MKKLIGLIAVISVLLFLVFTDCNKNTASNNSGNSGTTGTTSNPSAKYKGALVGSTGYLTAFLQGNNSYINVFYVDSSKTPVTVIKDSLTTSGLANWYPGQGNALSNVLFKGSSGITVTLVSVNADGSNPVVSMSVPNDPYAKVYMLRDSVASAPLQVYNGKATPVGNGVAGSGGNCTCAVKTINFVVNPAYIGSQYAGVTAIYIDNSSHLAGFLNGQISSTAPNQIVSIVNNNDTAGLHVYNGQGGPNSNNGSGYVNGSLTISADGNSISGTISGMYIPNYGLQSSSCACSYAITAQRVN